MAQPRSKRKIRKKREKPEFDQQIVDLARVTRVTKGGKQMSFRACLVIGDRKGRVGYGIQKGKDVQIAVDKALKQAKKNIITVPIVNETVPHMVQTKFKAAHVMIKPAPKGSGIIAGGTVRVVLEYAGVMNASAKLLSKTTNKITTVKAAFEALQMFKHTTSPQRKHVEATRNFKKSDVVANLSSKEEPKKATEKQPAKRAPKPKATTKKAPAKRVKKDTK